MRILLYADHAAAILLTELELPLAPPPAREALARALAALYGAGKVVVLV